jgi:hypothetical protein
MDHPWIPSGTYDGQKKTMKIDPMIPEIECRQRNGFFKGMMCISIPLSSVEVHLRQTFRMGLAVLSLAAKWPIGILHL